MAHVQHLNGSEHATTPDPWDWNVDQVVSALCDPKSHLRQSNSSLSLPDGSGLAAKLRELDVTGLALLQEVDSTCLRDDFGIRSLGHISSLKHLISVLRLESPKYQENAFRNSSSNFSRPHGSVRPGMNSAYYSTLHQSTPGPVATRPWQTPRSDNENYGNGLGLTFTPQQFDLSHVPFSNGLGTPVSQQPGLPTNGPFLTDDNHNDPARVSPTRQASPSLGHNGVQGEGTISMLSKPTATEPEIPPDMGKAAKAKKRIAPTLIAPLDPAKSQVASAVSNDVSYRVEDAANTGVASSPETLKGTVDESSHQAQAALDHDSTYNSDFPPPNEADPPEPVKPGVVHVDRQGRKRMIPVSLSEPGHEQIPITKSPIEEGFSIAPLSSTQTVTSDAEDELMAKKHITYGRSSQRLQHQQYLGSKALPVDDFFYPQTSLGNTIAEEEDSQHLHSSFLAQNRVGTGIRRYVNSRLKFFLQSKPLQLDRKHIGVIPYPERLAKKHVPLSMTVFSRNLESNLIAVRTNRAKWINNLTTQVSTNTEGVSDTFAITNATFAEDDADNEMWDSLQKWNYVEDAEAVLPAYGDSGSEGEYDLETWKEMEQECGEIERAEENPKKPRKPPLGEEKVREVIESVVEAVMLDWREKQRPKLEPKALRIWMRAKKDGTRNYQIHVVREQIANINARLKKQCDEILQEAWTNEVSLSRQCKIMQPSIFDFEELDWKKEVLLSKTRPEKVQGPSRKTRAKVFKEALEEPLAEGEEDLVSSNEDAIASEDSLDDFIISDDEDNFDINQPTIFKDDSSEADNEEEANGTGANDQLPSSRLELPNLPSMKLVKPEKVTPHKDNFIDLTQLSSDVDAPVTRSKPTGVIRVKTPPVDNGNESEVWQPSPRPKFKPPPRHSRPPSNIINLHSSTSRSPSTISSSPAKSQLPEYWDVKAIAKMDAAYLLEKQDRKRVLVYIIARSPKAQRNDVWRILRARSMEDLEDYVKKALKAMESQGLTLRGTGIKTEKGAIQTAFWFVAFSIPMIYSVSAPSIHQVEKTLSQMSGFEEFYDFLIECSDYYEGELASDETIEYPAPPAPPAKKTKVFTTPKKKKKRKLSSDSEDDFRPSNQRRRVNDVTLSQETIDMREAAQKRLHQNEERRRQELARDHAILSSDRPDAEVIVNPGKEHDRAYIYLDPRFGNGNRSLKPHQVSGLQFLWREITADQMRLQGCLLAHTMGLGKTSQVIALLVTLAMASRHTDRNVKQQVPKELRKSQTLILCPPALVENWWDELILWVPNPPSDIVGYVRKVSATMQPAGRIREVQGWVRDGGVLIMGYHTFTDLILNKATKSREQLLSEAAHNEVCKALLSKTSLVITDEAHEFKNKSTNLNRCVNRIRTTSRIAMTGSPLSNNLSEYFTIIDWISPKFLGSSSEFKALYEEPINAGLYQDSSEKQYREALKMLKALRSDIEPKVHRLDFSVLHNTLHGKLEFVIRLPLADIQRRLYRAFADAVLKAIAEGEPIKTTLWSWLKLLQLLCHHPKLYHNRLLAYETEIKAKPPSAPTSKSKTCGENAVSSNNSVLDNSTDAVPSTQSHPVTPNIIAEAKQLLSPLAQTIDSAALSWKMHILIQIVQLSVAANDKILVVSQHIPTLNFVSAQLSKLGIAQKHITGDVAPQNRQAVTKSFNEGSIDVCLISAKAGGLGLNLASANRVVILDEWYNPMVEQQAIGRAYRIGQKKPVYVYRLTVAGTFEEVMQNLSLFKVQLADRVVDKRQPKRSATRTAGEFIFPPKAIPSVKLDEFKGKDVSVLDQLLLDSACPILSIATTESFHVEDNFQLTAEEAREAEQIRENQRLKREDLTKYNLEGLKKNNVFRQFAVPNPPQPPAQKPVPPPAQAPSQPSGARKPAVGSEIK